MIDLLYTFLGCVLCMMFYSMYLFTKKQKLEIEEKEKIINSQLLDQEEAILKLMDVIDVQIELEMTHEFLPYISTSKNFDILTIDKICEKVSNNVFKSLNTKKLMKFNDYCGIYKDSFWANYIIKKTTCIGIARYLGTKKREN